MKTNILFIMFAGFIFISCGKKEEKKVLDIPVKKEVIEVVKVTTPPVIEVPEEVNPLSKYVSDEVYNEGVKIFYDDEESMFMEDTDEFSGSYEEFKAYVEARFKPTMLITQNGVNSAVVYYLEEGSKNRAMISGLEMIEIEDITYYIRVFKDRIEIKQGKNGRAVPLYLRER
ncbi:hypothetical protein [Psychrilyobacter atlanticus]|uniref:hypothetical protein n=1 Tax=Psychrilyobacter atlanticus TaxID=271091 RepID=UPI0004252F23|nr:hypothetical protein [Psychrilyobacter atlanticus]